MKNILVVGAIAGAVAGIVAFIFSYLLGNIGIFEPPGGLEIWDFSLLMLSTVALTSLGLIWGIVFSIIYARFYDRVPAKGAIKGLYFGLIIWLIKDIAAGSFVAFIGLGTEIAIRLISVGFFMWIAYGLVLGYLYKPPK